MDKELKIRKLASASVRRQRSQEREKQRQQAYEEREERKKRMGRMSSIYDSDDSDASRPGSPENDSSADTPSEHSLRTPDNAFSPKVEIKGQSVDLTVTQDLLKEDELAIIPKPSTNTVPIVKPTLLERRRSKLNPTQPILFTSSLSRPCDWVYDRFSTIIDPVDLGLKPEEEVKSSASAEESGSDDTEDDGSGDDDDYSPIELATPVAIRMPISRPSVVSVVGANAQPFGPQKFHVSNINTIMINPPKQPIPNRKPAIIETVPTPSSEVASEPAFPVVHANSESLTPSSASIISIEPSSTKSLPGTSIASTDASLKKKSSMPMLTRFKHARMNSIKNFMKPQSISGPPPAVPMIPTNHQARPSESVANILLSVNTHRSNSSTGDKNMPSSPRRSLTEPNLPKPTTEAKRPQTARAPSQSSINVLCSQPQSDVSAMPPPLPESSSNSWLRPRQEEMDNSSMTKKKSFQSFRRRSGSIGQALKFGSSSKSKSPGQEEPLPPMPVVIPAVQEPVQPVNLPTPPTRTPRQTRKSGMNYSPFPQPIQRGEPVGLGLRM